MSNDLQRTYETDKITWERCAQEYEKHIVGGHPDILAFEAFEEDFLDFVLHYIAEVQEKPIKLLDIGCGSGRLHLRYACKVIQKKDLQDSSFSYKLKTENPQLAYDPILSEHLSEVWGIDFSEKMIDLAKKKILEAKFPALIPINLTLRQGSAFDLIEENNDTIPVVVCLVNSIGVMQGPDGAAELFKSMRRAVESAGGIAIISAYQQEYIESHALGQYESTLQVSGQPRWLIPATYALSPYTQIAKEYKTAYSKDQKLIVDVLDSNGNLFLRNHKLVRDLAAVKNTIETGIIRTHGNYSSHWYSYQQFDEWIKKYWKGNSYHIKTKEFDLKRAEPAQIAIFDAGCHIGDIVSIRRNQ